MRVKYWNGCKSKTANLTVIKRKRTKSSIALQMEEWNVKRDKEWERRRARQRTHQLSSRQHTDLVSAMRWALNRLQVWLSKQREIEWECERVCSHQNVWVVNLHICMYVICGALSGQMQSAEWKSESVRLLHSLRVQWKLLLSPRYEISIRGANKFNATRIVYLLKNYAVTLTKTITVVKILILTILDIFKWMRANMTAHGA